MNINYRKIYSGPLVFQTRVIEEHLKEIEKLCIKDKDREANRSLAGIIDEEFFIDENKMQEILNPYLLAHQQAFKEWYFNWPVPQLKCITSWVNYMKAGECNPIHVHHGCDWSSVLFLNFPNKILEEQKKFKGSAFKPGNLIFTFTPDMKNHICNHEYTPQRGDFFLFPSNVYHSVPSYRSDCERISVACNFKE